MTQEMCDIIFEDPFVLEYYHYKYNTHEMCDKAVDSCLVALKFVSDCLLRVRSLENLIVMYFLMVK